jgi:hypothetical protein
MKSMVMWTLALGMAMNATGAVAQSKLYVAPEKGQDAAQQQKDESECRQWAQQQSGVNPAAPAAGPDRGQRLGGTTRGAARGAALGAAVGAIAGDAGKGAAAGAAVGGVKGRRDAVRGEQQAQASAASEYDRAFAACMEARGYTVR